MSELQIDRSVRKGSSVIMARHVDGVEFQVVDQILFNYLLLRAYNEIEPGAVHQIPVKDAMEYTRFDRVSRLHESVQRLCRGQIEIDYKEANGEDRAVFAHFLSGDVSKSENGLLKFAFDPILAHFLIEPKVFALVRVDRSRDFKSLASLKLYEAMTLQHRKRTSVWNVTTEELRNFFQVGDKHERFDNFKIKVIERAVADVNAVADFDVLVDYTRGGKGGAVVGVQFTAVSKSHSRLLEARTVTALGGSGSRRRPSDLHTVDMLDGLTFEERGGPAEITAQTFEEARTYISETDDLEQLLHEWRESVRGRTLSDPDLNFLAWLRLRIDQRNDPLLKDIDTDIFGSLLGGAE